MSVKDFLPKCFEEQFIKVIVPNAIGEFLHENRFSMRGARGKKIIITDHRDGKEYTVKAIGYLRKE